MVVIPLDNLFFFLSSKNSNLFKNKQNDTLQETPFLIKQLNIFFLGFPDGSVVKNPLGNAGGKGSIPGWGISPGKGNSNPL